MTILSYAIGNARPEIHTLPAGSTGAALLPLIGDHYRYYANSQSMTRDEFSRHVLRDADAVFCAPRPSTD